MTRPSTPRGVTLVSILLAIGCGSTANGTTPGSDAAIETGDSAPALDTSPTDSGSACGSPPYIREMVRAQDLDDTGAQTLLTGARVSVSTCAAVSTTDSKGEATAIVAKGTAFELHVDAEGHVPVIFAELLFATDDPTTSDLRSALMPRTPTAAALPDYGLDRPSFAIGVVASGTGPCAERTGAIFEVVDHPEAKAVTMNINWPKDPSPSLVSGAGYVTFFTGLAGGQHVSVKGAKTSCRVQLDARGQTGRFFLANGAFTIGNAVISDPG